MTFISRFRRTAALATLPALAVLAACDGDDPVSGQPRGNVAVILNSLERSLTIAPVEGTGAGATTLGLGAQGSPVNFAVRDLVAVVPMGTYPYAQVVDLATPQIRFTVPLPQGSGATGAAFLNDSIAVVANSDRNTVTPVNVLRGTAGAEVAVGVYPQAIVAAGGELYVLNGSLVNFQPAGPGSVTVLDSRLQVAKTIALSGTNTSAGVVNRGKLYVLNPGRFGRNEGSLSVVDLESLREERHVPGFGDFPGALDVGPDGNLYVALYAQGIIVWNPGTRTFVRGIDDPAGPTPVSGLGFDVNGRLHTLNPGDCLAPGSEYRLDAAFTIERTLTTGVCPFYIAFARTPAL